MPFKCRKKIAFSSPEVVTTKETTEVFDPTDNTIKTETKEVLVNDFPHVPAVDNQTIDQIRAGVPVRKVSTMIDTNDRLECAEDVAVALGVPRETITLTEN